MSSKNSKNKRSVRFVEADTKNTQAHKRRGHNSNNFTTAANNDGDGRDGNVEMDDVKTTTTTTTTMMMDRKPPAAAAVPSSNNMKMKVPKGEKRYRPNEDELDDIDEWDEEEDGEGDGAMGMVTESQLLQAKRRRRQRGVLNDDDDYNDEEEENDDKQATAETSLAAEGIKIEPFHMREEETDGSGYFDGDTYVFRRRSAEDGEPDAWADSLNDEDGNPTTDLAYDTGSSSVNRASGRDRPSQEDMDELTKEQLYERIVPLVSDTETVARAIRRYGQLVKQQNPRKGGKRGSGKQQQATTTEDTTSSEVLAKSCLDTLTGAANALLLQGEVDIYDTTRQDILRKFPSQHEDDVVAATGRSPAVSFQTTTTTTNGTTTSTTAATPASSSSTAPSTKKSCQWEYLGNQDNEIHGPFTTEQMLDWVQAGYFVGTQRVQIRTVQEEEEEEEEKKLSTQDDLLADLMDDDDDEDNPDDDKKNNDEDEDEDDSRPSKRTKKTLVKGEWMWSNEVDYNKYL